MGAGEFITPQELIMSPPERIRQSLHSRISKRKKKTREKKAVKKKEIAAKTGNVAYYLE